MKKEEKAVNAIHIMFTAFFLREKEIKFLQKT